MSDPSSSDPPVTRAPTVAIIGASKDRSKYGNRSLRAHLACGYTVFPVNPRSDSIEGLTAYGSVTDIPVDRLDRVSMYVPPNVGLELLEAIARKGCDELWLNPGSNSTELIALAEKLSLNVISACSLMDCQANGAEP